MHLGALPPAFAGLDDADATEAAGFLQPISLAAGDLIMEQGEEDYTLAFVVQGTVQLTDHHVRVGAAATRDLLGEVELFAQVPRQVTATASSPTHLLVLAHEHWQELCERGNPAVYNLERAAHRRISERLRFLNEGIAELTRGAPFALHPKPKGLMGSLSRLLGGGAKPPPQVDVHGFLSSSRLFSWADASLLTEIAAAFEVERFEAESVICRQGEIGDKVYVVVEGHVDVVILIDKDRADTVAILGQGHAFGDAALAQNAPRSASCVCHEDVVALSMSREKYGALFAANDPTGSVFRQAMLRNLIEQLSATQTRFVALAGQQPGHVEDTIRGTPVSSVWRD